MKVRHVKTGRIGAVEKVITKNYCTVQFVRNGYYEMCRIDDLEPATEDEFVRRFR